MGSINTFTLKKQHKKLSGKSIKMKFFRHISSSFNEKKSKGNISTVTPCRHQPKEEKQTRNTPISVQYIELPLDHLSVAIGDVAFADDADVLMIEIEVYH